MRVREGYRRGRTETTEKGDGSDASLSDGVAGLADGAERARVDGCRVREYGEDGGRSGEVRPSGRSQAGRVVDALVVEKILLR